MEPRTPVVLLWLLRLAASSAAGVAGYLFSVSLTQQGLPAGCGAGSGCADVLTSRWAYVLGVSITAPALAVYLGLLTSTFAATSQRSLVRALAWHILLSLAAAIVVSAAWFIALQLVVLKNICPWCMAEHSLGILTALLALVLSRRISPPVSVLSLVACTMIGVFGVGLLAATQVVTPGPRTTILRIPSDHNADTGPGDDRQISVLNGSLPLVIAEEPTLGDPQAKHLVVVLFDYCCPHCRETHGHLVEGLKTYRNQYGLVLLPMPLDKSCNPHVDETEPRFKEACQLARLALAVWKADRSKFAEFDHWLFEPEQPRTLAEARKQAESLIPRDKLESALADPGIEKSLLRNIAAYDRSVAGRIPVILSPEFATIVGRPADAEQLFQILETDLKLVRP